MPYTKKQSSHSELSGPNLRKIWQSLVHYKFVLDFKEIAAIRNDVATINENTVKILDFLTPVKFMARGIGQMYE